MDWNCPHCGITLAVGESQLGTGWSFSRCYKCGGFALIRKAEINVIKVDKAPPGERVILPEGSEDPSVGSLNKGASEMLSKHMSGKINTPPPISPEKIQTGNVKNLPYKGSQIPVRLPSLKRNTLLSKIRNVGIFFSSVLFLISGVYLLVHGSNLWKGTLETANSDSFPKNPIVSTTDPKSYTDNTLSLTGKPTLTIAQETINKPDQLMNQKQNLKQIITDQVQQSAMAPLKAPFTPEIKQPDKFEPKSEAKIKGLIVRSANSIVNIHTGPGIHYPVIAKTTPNAKYIVADWSDRWFKVLLDNPTKSGTPESIGWIQNNLVKVMTE